MVADAIAVPSHSQSSEEGENALALETMASAFRITERDMKAALSGGAARSEGDDRNFYAIRTHLRLSQREMAELNRRLDALLGIVLESIRRAQPSDEDEFVSLTLALVPLPNRSTGSS